MNTPWGRADSVEKIETGVSWVSTPSHGGLMVSLAVGLAKFSVAAIGAAMQFGGYLCFEEDCQYAIAFFERPDWKRFLDSKSLAEWKAVLPGDYLYRHALESIPRLEARLDRTDEQIREEMRAIVTRWHPEYFGTSVGIACPACGSPIAWTVKDGWRHAIPGDCVLDDDRLQERMEAVTALLGVKS